MSDPERTVLIPCAGEPSVCAAIASLAGEGRRVVAAHLDAGRPEPGATDGCVACARAREHGAARTVCEDLRGEVYALLAWVLRAAGPEDAGGGVWAAAEGYALGARLAALASEVRAEALVLGREAPPLEASLGAALRHHAPELTLLPPVADAPPAGLQVRQRLWGTLAWGGPLEDAWEEVPEEATPNLPPPWEATDLPEEFDLELEAGLVTHAFGRPLDGVNLFAQLTRLGRLHGVGRGARPLAGGGREVWEAPAATLIIAARRALERAALDPARLALKDRLARDYLDRFVLGELFAPLMRDLEAALGSSQAGVGGEVRLQLSQATVEVLGVRPARGPTSA